MDKDTATSRRLGTSTWVHLFLCTCGKNIFTVHASKYRRIKLSTQALNTAIADTPTLASAHHAHGQPRTKALLSEPAWVSVTSVRTSHFCASWLPCIIFTVKQSGLSHKDQCACSHGGKCVASALQTQLCKLSFENIRCCNSWSVVATAAWTPVCDAVGANVARGKLEKGLQWKLFNNLQDDTYLQLNSLHILRLILGNLGRKASFITFIRQIGRWLAWRTGGGISFAKCRVISVHSVRHAGFPYFLPPAFPCSFLNAAFFNTTVNTMGDWGETFTGSKVK